MSEKIPENLIHEETSDSPQESVGKLSVEQGEQLTKTVGTLSKITEDIQDGIGVEKSDIEKLESDLDNTPVQLGPYAFPARRLMEFSREELERQASILQQIFENTFHNLRHLKIINPEISKQLEKVKGDLRLESLTSAEGLTLPTNIEGSLLLDSLTSAEGLTLPTNIEGGLYLESLSESEKQKLREQRPDLSDKI